MAVSAEEAVLGAIDAASIDNVVRGENLLRGPVRPPLRSGTFTKVPHKAIFCLGTGGFAPIACVNGGEGPDLRSESVQVRIRANVGEYLDGFELAESVWNACQRATVTGYLSLTCRESAPGYIGTDDTEHHEWTINIDTVRSEA